MRDWLRGELKGLVDLLFPPACPLCSAALPAASAAPFCPSCMAELQPLPRARCSRCALPFPATENSSHLCTSCTLSLPSFGAVVAAGVYEAGLRRAIQRFKYEGGCYLDRPLVKLLLPLCATEPASDLIVPVPLHRQRLQQRTYNQSLLLARELGRGLQIPVADRLLERIRHTPPQQGLSARERARNLRGAFRCRTALAGERLLLVDDVMTTGATAAACSQLLLKAGAGEVKVAVLGRAGRH